MGGFELLCEVWLFFIYINGCGICYVKMFLKFCSFFECLYELLSSFLLIFSKFI